MNKKEAAQYLGCSEWQIGINCQWVPSVDWISLRNY